MRKTIFISVTAIFFSLSCKAQDLTKITFTLKTDSISYISIADKKMYAGSGAIAHKQNIDFALVPSVDGTYKKMEWYNLSGKDDKLPSQVLGTATKIAAISFDRDQFTNCKTAADLKRMTDYLTTNSLSHFAVIQNGNANIQHCFIFEKENGKRGLMYITITKNDELVIETKSE